MDDLNDFDWSSLEIKSNKIKEEAKKHEEELGIVKWFDETKGFGVIVTPEMGEIFLHKSNLQINHHNIVETKSLIFKISIERGRKTATEVRTPSSYEDFCFIFSYINKPNIIKEIGTRVVRVSNRRKKRESYIIEKNIFFAAISQFFNGRTDDELILFYRRYFDENFLSTAKKEFIEFLKAFRSTCFGTFNHRNISVEHLFYFLTNVDKKLLFTVWSNKLDELPERSLIPRRTNRTVNNNVFEYPENIFIDNYDTINLNELERLFKQPNGEQIITQILLIKIETIDSIKSYLYTIFRLIAKFQNQENIVKTKSILTKTIINFFKKINIEERNQLNDFNDILKELKKNYDEIEFCDFIHQFNETLSADALFKLWRKTSYFEPDVTFFNRNFALLNYREFIKSPKEFHQFYVKARLAEIGTVRDAKSFALLILLIVEIPIKLGEEVLNDLPLLYKLIVWFTFQNSNSTKKYYETEYNLKDLKIDENEITDFFKTLDSIDEVGYLLSVVIKVQQKYQYLISSYNNDGCFKLNNSERVELILDYLKEKDIDKDKAIRVLYKSIPEKYLVSFTKILIPGLIQSDEISSGSLKIFENFLNIGDSKIQKELFQYVGNFTSNNQQVKLFLDGHIESIELSIVIAEFNSIKISEQPNLLRRMFFLLHSNIISSADDYFEQLISLLFKNNINVNVRMCIKVLESLRENNSYVRENIISDIVCEYVNDDTQEIIQLDDLIEKCNGRTWMTDGEHQRNWYLNIKGKYFPVEDDMVKINEYSYYFDEDSRTVDIDGKRISFTWYKEEGNIFTRKYEIPEGLIFCDAQKSEFEPSIKKQFYWCVNSKCFSPCQNDHLDFEWRTYSLRDFIKILGLSFNDDYYYRFISVVNRANRLLKKLQCNSCKRLLRDSRTSEFAVYRVTTFHCTNPNCEEYHQVIYLNHCLNWRCLNVVDSRVSKQCPNGWYICDKCDNCCSQAKIERRYSSLLMNNAFNSNNYRHQKLKHQVDNKLGHLEKGEVYDYKTGLIKINSDHNGELQDDLPF